MAIYESASDNTIGGSVTGAGDVISGNDGSGVSISSASNTVDGDYIGTNSSGATNLHNLGSGVALLGASSNTIGGTSTTAADVISGNGIGVQIAYSGADHNVVEGDYIGTNSASKSVPNEYGVVIQLGASANTIGGTTTGARDVISANTNEGVNILSNCTDNAVDGDYIGLAVGGGASVLGNGGDGVQIYEAASNTIGGNVTGAADIISGNGSSGVEIDGPGANDNLVAGDRIGTGSGGMVAAPNCYGVELDNGATGNTIGGTTAIMRNLISGNTEDGVHIVDSGTNDNVVEGDYIGVNVDGTGAVPNGASGVAIYASASDNTIGGSVAGSGNVVSGNTGDGFYISGGATNANVVEGDLIGTDYTGSVKVPNDEGVYIGGGATNNTIGGTTAATRDVISGNTTNGVEMFSVGTAGNVVEGDYIGTSASGSSALGNDASGVAIHGGANNNTVGGTASGSGNVISGNVGNGSGNGVYIADPNTVGNLLEGNLIGTDYTGTIRLRNAVGVYIGNGASNNTVGPGNVIAANFNGVVITGTGTSNNVVDGCYIGTNASTQAGLGNTNDGVLMNSGASSNEVEGCAIAMNDNNGVELDSGTSNNTIEGNLIVSNTKYGVLDEGTGNSETDNIFAFNGAGPIDT